MQLPYHFSIWITVLPAIVLSSVAGCDRTEPSARNLPAQGGTEMKSLTITSEAFKANETIPRKYTGDGQDKSPPLAWSDLPPGTKELALVVDDPDAPTPQPWVHWVLYAIPSELSGLPEGIAPALRVSEPAGLLQGKNSWGNIGYGGPAPPKGHGLHHYHFKLYALDISLNVDPGASKATVMDAIAGHILAQGELIGTYQR